ncbi:MAG: carboxypeptidase regulatory-like domain-containing protein [Acidobacteria bacterium]|nr:carboxypeptidase regulatory-like domain-containing protein [Acidobacteriota bacterium]
MVRIFRFAIIAFFISVGAGMAQTQAPAAAAAPGWHGKGRMGGRVIDEAGKLVPGVTIKFQFIPANAGPEVVTDAKGEWRLQNIAEGMWSLQYWKDGFDPRMIPVQVGGKVKEPLIELKMTKEGTDPSFAVPYGNDQARALIGQKKVAEAKAVYAKLLATYPTYNRLHLALSQCLDMEGKFAESAAELQLYVTANPTDVRVKTYLGTEYIKAKQYAEAWQVYSSIDLTQITDPLDLNDPGFMLLRASKSDEAYKYFNLAVTRFPEEASGYYYRGVASRHFAGTIDKTKTAEIKTHLIAAQGDMTKFLEMAGPTAATADDTTKQNMTMAKQVVDEIAKLLTQLK